MSITYEFLFQILNTLFLIIIPLLIYFYISKFLKKYKNNQSIMNNKIKNLEEQIENLSKK